ncbi:MAG: alpha/beta hydrolase [Polyangia bacterium]
MPEANISRIRWSGGSTQMIDLGREQGPGREQGGDNPPLLLLHGGLGEAFQWAPILAQLGRHRRVLAVDRPGHGLADPFDARGIDLMAHAATFIADVLDAAGAEQAALVGSSMGGLFATAFALAHPARVEHLILQSPAGATGELPLMLRLGTLPGLRALVRAQMRKPTRDSMRGFWKQLLVAHPERLPDEFLDLSALSQARNAESWFALLDRTVDVRGLKRDLLAGARFADLQVPTTLLWGDKDAFASPIHTERLRAQNPRLRVVHIADAGHAPWFDQPEATATAILTALGALPARPQPLRSRSGAPRLDPFRIRPWTVVPKAKRLRTRPGQRKDRALRRARAFRKTIV